MNPMMEDPNKKIAALIIKGGEGEPGELKQTVEVDNDIPMTVAAKEVLEAVESKDIEGIKTALKSFVRLCKDEQTDDYESDFVE